MGNQHREMHRLDTPEAYDDLTSIEKETLAYWIDHAMCHAARYSKRTSYGIKHDFEYEGFYITNGQFKGAMLAAGYQPKDANELNWAFKVKPCRDLSSPRDDPGRFQIEKNQPQHQRYAQMLAQVQEEYRHQEAARKEQQGQNERR